MAETRTCEECGAALPPNTPQGLCPRCLLGIGLSLASTMEVPKSDFQIERTGTMIGRYKLLEKIGEGGFGVVYMAEQVEPVQRKVALKIIKAGMDTKEVVARFEAERQAIALMDHPNIARGLDAGATEAGRPYFVMELVRGIPITDYCDQAQLPTRERLKLFMKVCQAVQHAHQKGVIHRDLKPSNVLVTIHDSEPVPKVIDFGVAKALGQRLTEKTLFTGFQHMIGTPAYMSPEQAALSGLDIDTRADIYSLGVLLYELLTGVTPFDADTLRKAALDEVRRMIRETEPLKPSTRLQTLGEKLPQVARHRQTEAPKLIHQVRGDLDWIVMTCLEKDRSRRYATASGLATDLQRHLSNEPVMARPPSVVYRAHRMIRRNKPAFAAAIAIGSLLLAAVSLYVRAVQREQRKTEAALEEAITNFRLARKAIQEIPWVILGGSENDKLGPFLEMYRKARAAKPDDPDLLTEYVRLLAVKSQGATWSSTNTGLDEAETNLDEAIGLLESSGTQRRLGAEERFQLAQICQQRVRLWETRSQARGAKSENESDTPGAITALQQRAQGLAEELVRGNPGGTTYVMLYFDLQGFTPGGRARNILEIRRDTAIVKEFLKHQPDNRAGLALAQYCHWNLGKAEENSKEAAGHFREVLSLSARLMRAPSLGPNRWDGYELQVPKVNLLKTSSALLHASDAVDRDIELMTNLLSAAEFAAAAENRPFLGSALYSFPEEDGTNRFQGAMPDSLVAGLPPKIIYQLMSHGRYDQAISFVNQEVAKLEGFARQSERSSYVERKLSRLLEYLQLSAAAALLHLGRPGEVGGRLEAASDSDMLKLLQESGGDDLADESLPRIPDELEIRHRSAAVLEESYMQTGRTNLARKTVEDFLLTLDQRFKNYGERVPVHRCFALARRSAIEATVGRPEDAARSREESVNALKEVADYRLYSLARMLAMAAEDSIMEPSRRIYSELAVSALKRYAGFGARTAEELRTDREFRALVDRPELRELLPLFDEGAHAFDRRLASQTSIEAADRITLMQAAARRSKVRISGRIASARSDLAGFILGFVGGDPGHARGQYGANAPTSIGRTKDLSELVGRDLVFVGTPTYNSWGVIVLDLTNAEQIVSFRPREEAGKVAATNLVLAPQAVLAGDLGKRLKVQGKIEEILGTRDGGLEMSFRGVAGRSFVVSMARDYRNFPPGYTKLNLIGATVRISGVVEVVDGYPQILMSDSRQMEVLIPGPGSNTHPAATTNSVVSTGFRKPIVIRPDERASRIEPRSADAPAVAIDLSDVYNADPDTGWTDSNPQNSLFNLSRGLRTFDGVQFDVRGLVQLRCKKSLSEAFPKEVSGIRIGQRCRRVHILHAASMSWGTTNGVAIGEYVFRQEGVAPSSMPIRFGGDVEDWWFVPQGKTNGISGANIVWTARNGQGHDIQLFKSTWENPYPEIMVATMDFISAMSTAAPFLIAVTVEP